MPKTTPYQLNKPQWNVRGENSSNWKGGITGERQTLRTRVEFKFWRRQVFAANLNVCAVCGESDHSLLVAHHIKDFNTFIDLRYVPSNGIIVCRACHPSIHCFGLDYMMKLGKPKLDLFCSHCGKKFSVKLRRKDTARFCSRRCRYAYMRKNSTFDHLAYKRKWYMENRDRLLSALKEKRNAIQHGLL